MNNTTRIGSTLALVLCYACGSATGKPRSEVASKDTTVTAAPGTAAPSSAGLVAPTADSAQTSLVFDGIKLTARTKEGEPRLVEVKTDGTVLSDGKPFGMFVKDEFKLSPSGTTILRVMADGAVQMPLGDTSLWMAFNDKDDLLFYAAKKSLSLMSKAELTSPGQGKGTNFLSIDETGNVAGETNLVTKKVNIPLFKFDAVPPKSKRAAVLLAVALSYATDESSTTGKPPAVSPAKPK
jgi:hypothetical protein